MVDLFVTGKSRKQLCVEEDSINKEGEREQEMHAVFEKERKRRDNTRRVWALCPPSCHTVYLHTPSLETKQKFHYSFKIQGIRANMASG